MVTPDDIGEMLDKLEEAIVNAPSKNAPVIRTAIDALTELHDLLVDETDGVVATSSEDDFKPTQLNLGKHHYQQFIDDMVNAGLDVEHYRGRFYFEGPAVRVEDIQDALSHTKVKCQWDQLGLGYIVYPKH